MTMSMFSKTVFMKNKVFHRVAVFLIIFWGITGRLSAQIHFEVTPLYQLTNGCLNELVFYINNDDVYKLSELNWNIKNISFVGEKIGISYKWFQFESSLLGAFSKKSAKMYDSDWQDIPANPEMKTTFSISENRLRHSFNFDSKISFAPDITDWLKTGLFLQYNINQICFSARNGYGWYGEPYYTKEPQCVPFDSEKAKFFAVGSLQGIDYYRVTSFFNIGLSCSFYILDRIQIKIEAGISPYLTVNSIDHHHMKGYFRDEIKSSFSSNSFGTDVRFNLYNNIYLGCSFLYNYIRETKGITYTNPEKNKNDDIDFGNFDKYYLDSSYLSGASGKWYTITTYCSFVF